MSIAVKQRQALEQAARQAANASYSPYSRFPVGAAVLAADDLIYTGANIENASFGLSCCAERVAIYRAVAAGNRRLQALAIFTPTPQPTAPCGACRQVLAEFAEEASVLCICRGEGRLESSVAELLPDAFGPAGLVRESGHD